LGSFTVHRSSTSSDWKSMQVTIGPQDPPLILGILAYSSGSSRLYLPHRGEMNRPIISIYAPSYLALDNFRLVDCAPSSSSNTTDKPVVISALDCDFETNLCGWTLVGPNRGVNWFITN